MSSQNSPVALAFPPGDFIREELEARDWTQSDLAKIIGRPLHVVNSVINGKKEITLDIAVSLGVTFRTSTAYWLNLEAAYRLSKLGIINV